MIALAALRSLGAWLLGTRDGRIILATLAGLCALQAFATWQRHTGARDERARVERADNQAAERAREAERTFHGDGGAAGRLRNGAY